MKFVKKFCLAAAYVTRLPLCSIPKGDDALSGLSKYLPAVGLMLGSILCAEAAVLEVLHVKNALVGVVLTLSWLALTGGIHFDGLMDTADGIFSHRSRERMLEIMSDSRVGNFGVMIGLSVLLVKLAALSSFEGPRLVLALLLVPAWARWCETFTIGYFPYLKEQGMGKIWHDSTIFPSDVFVAAILPVSVTVACLLFQEGPGPAAKVAAATAACGLGAAFYLGSILKGQTGDTYGAVVELAEAGALLLLSLISF